ncbi:hypothetical protein QUW13_11035 [Enterococcus hirae]|nr:hypothetical protein [Enterococcus hirae]
MAEKQEKFILSDFVVKDLLAKADSKQFEIFLKERGFRSSGSKDTKIYNMKNSLDKMEDESFDDEIIHVESFFLNQVKYTSNRIIITYPFEMSLTDPLYSISSLERFLGESIDEISFSKFFDNSMPITEKFEEIYQDFCVSEGKISKVEQIYVRRVIYSDIKEKCEFVWIEIDCVSKEVRIHLENNAKNLSVELQGKPMAIYKHFSLKLQREFLIIALPNPQETTLFKLYRKLTSYAEKDYLDKVELQQSEIDNFANTMLDSGHLGIDDTIDIANRIKWVFVRQLIQNDFDKFLKIQQRGEGKVKSILFHYDEGGTINANSGSSNESDVEELDLERQSAYFDTRESIYTSKKLFSITVNWTIELPEQETKQVLTRYRAYQPFLMTHFLKENVSKGVYDDIFPRIKEFENLPL